MAYQAFEFLRGLVVGRAGPAQRHARWVVRLEQLTGTFHERGLNTFVDHHKTLAQAMDIYYGTIHFLIPPLVLIWLWRRHPHDYRRWRTILVATTVASMGFFWALPLAPPRLYGGPAPATGGPAVAGPCRAAASGFIDTDACYGGMGPLDRGNFTDANPYAAMPSLHVAWSTWCACAVIGALGKRRRWRGLALLYSAWTLTVVVGTANHWFADAIGGWIVLAATWAGVSWWMGSRHRGKEGGAYARSGPDRLGGAVLA